LSESFFERTSEPALDAHNRSADGFVVGALAPDESNVDQQGTQSCRSELTADVGESNVDQRSAQTYRSAFIVACRDRSAVSANF